MFTRIAIAFDESLESQRAYRSAVELAQLTSAHLFLITVIEGLPAYMSYVSAIAPDVPRMLRDERRSFYADLHAKAIKDAAVRHVIAKAEMAEGDEVETLLTLLNDLRPDLLVVGLRQEDGVTARLIGGTAHRLALHAKCNVLGIR